MSDSSILNASGQPARKADEMCPSCGKKSPRGDTRARTLSGGFGQVHDVCTNCGHDFDELTLDLVGR